MEIIKIKLSLSNAYLVKDKKSILIDTGSPKEADKILSAVKQAGVSEKDISLILHTHGHVDHAGSTAELKRRLGIPSAIHKEDAFMLQTGTNGLVNAINFEAEIYKKILVKPFEASEPDILIENEISLNDFGVDGKIIFTSGHTKGSISILFGNNEMIIGDVMMGGFMGGIVFPSRPTYHYFYNDFDEIKSSIKKIVSMKPTKMYVGHGGALTFDDVRKRFLEIL
jgi:glyoxylase-like metal-dependent hydrolase (beta-lactamase superfamily II)